MRIKPVLALALLLYVTTRSAAVETAILQLKVLEGEGAIHAAGARSARPLTLQVTDETGRPLQGVAVSFRLTEEVHGAFRSGLKTEVLISASDGRVSVVGMQWGQTTGPVRIRVTAVKDQARAGAVITQYVSDQPLTSGHGKSRWKLIAVIAAGAIGGGLAAGMAGSKQVGATTPGSAAPATPGVQIGTPTISVGKP